MIREQEDERRMRELGIFAMEILSESNFQNISGKHLTKSNIWAITNTKPTASGMIQNQTTNSHGKSKPKIEHPGLPILLEFFSKMRFPRWNGGLGWRSWFCLVLGSI